MSDVYARVLTLNTAICSQNQFEISAGDFEAILVCRGCASIFKFSTDSHLLIHLPIIGRIGLGRAKVPGGSIGGHESVGNLSLVAGH